MYIMSKKSQKGGTETPIIPKDTIKRLAKDVKEINKNPLSSNGIYYKHSDENILKGYALIIGPQDTEYADGYYFFVFDFPADYPYQPPKVTFKTNQDRIRFHPNLYTTGKVCLSMLNTWRGEQWTSCQTISSMLLTMCTLFTKDPLLNEPGINPGHVDINKYNDIIAYKNIECAILNIVRKHSSIYIPMFDMFQDIVMEKFIENHQRIFDTAVMLSKTKDTKSISTRIYSMNVILEYKLLIEYFTLVKDNVLDNSQSDIRTDNTIFKSSSSEIEST